MLNRKNQRGVSLLEIAIAVLVFGTGLLGMGAMVGSSVKIGQGAFLKAQAVFMAGNLADRMRANTMATWAGSYSGTYSAVVSAPDCTNTACNAATVATWDLSRWTTSFLQNLPQSTGTVACTWNGAGFPGFGSLIGRPTLDGTCRISMVWSLSLDEGVETDRYTLVFQP